MLTAYTFFATGLQQARYVASNTLPLLHFDKLHDIRTKKPIINAIASHSASVIPALPDWDMRIAELMVTSIGVIYTPPSAVWAAASNW